MKLPRKLSRLEHDEQRDVIVWARATKGLELLFSVPNGARTSFSVAKRLKAEGLRAGVPDLILPVARGGYHGLYVEMKRVDGVPSDVSAVQQAWHLELRHEGYCVKVCFGFMQARNALTAYLALADWTP